MTVMFYLAGEKHDTCVTFISHVRMVDAVDAKLNVIVAVSLAAVPMST